ncbi:helix-turn-helix transcriptional regulator [Dactylosporangium sp. NBC_01737]|uniref:helix-turn-helix domain-containing protein n=1 Tax=Dactylosporangium sp. NBC_01737 TaxID=2975959 RepID=UPI002E0E2846|nr:helix-turn-helix transcriptional regulator [Dactylosporangium sp. NBC_01737]
MATFDALGATAWADRSRGELRASGETLRRPSTDAAQSLAPQETQIARLAADGLSNRDIAARLFLSPRTVTTHPVADLPQAGHPFPQRAEPHPRHAWLSRHRA